jgi:hypothetical protein
VNYKWIKKSQKGVENSENRYKETETDQVEEVNKVPKREV